MDLKVNMLLLHSEITPLTTGDKIHHTIVDFVASS